MISIVIMKFNGLLVASIPKVQINIAVINTMATDKRKYLRFELPVDVKLTDTSGEEIILKSQDISDSGLFLRGDSSSLPSVGEVVVIQLASLVAGDAPREITAKVVRQNNEGIGLEFVLDGEN